MSEEKALEFRGDVRAITANGKTIAWVTQHPQQQPTAVYRLDAESMEMDDISLPSGAVSILATDKVILVGGDDNALYQLTPKGKKPKQIVLLPGPAMKLAPLSDKRLAAICDSRLIIIDLAKDSVLQELDLAAPATALASDPGGQWIAVGVSDGNVSVFECEDKDKFQISETEKLHNGAVSSLLFEPEELRFFSAGADQKLLLTHARGRLEPEDRGRGNSHSERVTAMLHVPGERFITGSRDRSMKTWARVGAAKPATQSDGVSAVVDMALCEIHGRTQIAVACSDNSIRFFLIDVGGRFGTATTTIQDAYARAKQLLSHNEPSQRGEGLTSLAKYDDNRSIEMLAAHIDDENDHKLRLRTTELLSASKCPLAAKLLEPLLKKKDQWVRETAFGGLCQRADSGDLQPMRLALDSGHHNVGTMAIERLAKLANTNEIANQLIVESINHKLSEVRTSAQLQLETISGAKSPDANLTALNSSQADARILALVRLHQRGMIDLPRVQAAIRRALDDRDAGVRMQAFLVSTIGQKKLASALRYRDEDLHRNYHALENIGKAKSKDVPKAKKTPIDVPDDQLDPLLTAMASRATDTSLRGARALAMLGDPRSLGTLLQLSREEDEKMRGDVCRALADLGDSRAADRLMTMLDDSSESVRDAAFTSFALLTEQAPLEAAESGLSSLHEDIRRRALQSLVAFMRKSAKNKKDTQARELLVRALNDGDASVRGEAFKATLNMQLDGGDDKTLRFVLSSVHVDVRREVLTETIANEKQDWAKTLLFELFSDPHAELRKEAFEHAIGQSKKRDIEPMRAGLASRFSDIRLSATNELITLATPEAQELLATAIDDDEKQVRQAALSAIVDQDAADTLRSSLANKHDDVKLRVACALAATHGDSAARDVLLEFVSTAEPENDDDKATWQQNLTTALVGLADLGDSDVAPTVQPLLQSSNVEIRAAATRVFASFLDHSAATTLTEMMRDSDASVSVQAAIGVAICGDTQAMPVVFDRLADDGLEATQLIAATVYDEAAESRLIGLLDHSEDWIATVALMTLLARDQFAHDGTPRRCIACLSAKSPRARLAAARAVESFGDSSAFTSVLSELVNDRGDADDWSVEPASISEIAATLVFATSPIRQRLILALRSIANEKQESFDQHWTWMRHRFASEIEQAVGQSGEPPQTVADADELTQIAFGAYVGLVREQGGYHHRGSRPSFGASVIAIRETAIRRLLENAGDDAAKQASARPVLVQALGDPNQAVRDLAFASLPSLGIDDDARAFAAIESGQVDLAVKGMQLLTSNANVDSVQKILTDVIHSGPSKLAHEAAKLLADKTDYVEAAKTAIDCPFQSLRSLAGRWLAEQYEKSAEAEAILKDALDSKYVLTRHRAAVILAAKKNPAAYDALVKLLASDDTLRPFARHEIEQAFSNLGDPRAADAMLDRIENDPEKTARVEQLFQVIGQFRDPKNVDRMLSMMDQDAWCWQASNALLTISGFDQPIEDIDEEHEDKSWMESQHPRHDDVLAELIDRHLQIESNPQNLVYLVQYHARWSLSDAVEDVLARLVSHSSEDLRRAAVGAIGWRLKYRDGAKQPLIDALEHKDIETKFLAAEGLARGRHDEGIAVLMSAVELMSDLGLRIRAIEALGELANPRALDLLVKIAGDDLHALQGPATTAIGHLSETDRAEEIFAILKRLVAEPSTSKRSALIGLRHFGSAEAWDLLREHAKSSGDDTTALIQLSYNDDEANRELFLDALSGFHGTWEVFQASRRLFGIDSVEPDCALLRSDEGYDMAWESEFRCVARICQHGEAAEILKLVPACYDDVLSVLSANLMQRDPLPIDAAAEALESPHPITVKLAAQIIGRSADKANGKKIGAGIASMLGRWNEAYEQWLLRGEMGEDVEPIVNAIEKLCWAASRTGAAKSDLIEMSQAHSEEQRFNGARVAAVEALAEMNLTNTDLGKLKSLANDDLPEIRRIVSRMLVTADPNSKDVIEPALSDRGVYRDVVAAGGKTESLVTSAISKPHQQAIVLRTAITDGQIDLLAETANDSELADHTRLGAIESLGKLGTTESMQQLAGIGGNDEIDEELRKAAWRARRRCGRLLEATQ